MNTPYARIFSIYSLNIIIGIFKKPDAIVSFGGSKKVRGYYKKIDNADIAAFVFEEGPYKGKLATTFKPNLDQLKEWGIN